MEVLKALIAIPVGLAIGFGFAIVVFGPIALVIGIVWKIMGWMIVPLFEPPKPKPIKYPMLPPPTDKPMN